MARSIDCKCTSNFTCGYCLRNAKPYFFTPGTATPNLRPGRGGYVAIVNHGEHGSTWNVVDTTQPESEQPCVVHSWSTATEPQARYLAEDFCRRHNAG